MKAKEIYNKTEFWLVTITAAAFILALLVASKEPYAEGSYWFAYHQVQFDFFKNLFNPGMGLIALWYGAYIFISKFFEDNTNNWARAGCLVCVYLIVATGVGILNTYIDGWKLVTFPAKQSAYNDIFIDSFTTTAIVFILYVFYYILKQVLFNYFERKRTKPLNRDKFFIIVLAIASWIALLIVFAANNSSEGVAIFGIGIPYLAILIWMHFKYLIPLAGIKGYKSKEYIIRVIPIIFLLSLLLGALAMAISGSHDFPPIFFMIFFLTFFIAIPLIWIVAGRQQEKTVLQKALGSSEANLSFLRAQINPHFLFNALNTLYGTALQEHAERTGEGIQKLGDMMRFMLHENTQDKISLAREVDYLNNYIDLQKLRTATSPNIIIQTNIEEPLNGLNISPMLLIPFVENAFKHGISLQQPSFINISLHTKENVLFFDVNNSVHIKNEYDPEKMKSGIGLQNVKQRLALLYPKKYELIIRESGKEFFVHLTINL